MSKDNLQAPWIGLCEDDYLGKHDTDNILGHCDCCQRYIYEDEEYYFLDEDRILCKECYEGEKDLR